MSADNKFRVWVRSEILLGKPSADDTRNAIRRASESAIGRVRMRSYGTCGRNCRQMIGATVIELSPLHAPGPPGEAVC